MKLVVDIPNSLYANLQTIQNGSVAAKRILQCVRDGEKQELKTGHWIRWYEQKENDGCIEHIPHCKCSECGKEYIPRSSRLVKYCIECGAKMEGGENDKRRDS